jgi:hypothetical protein
MVIQTLKTALVSAIIGLLIVALGNFLSNGWLLRFLGGFAFNDVSEITDAGSYLNEDMDNPALFRSTPVKGTTDDDNRRYFCFLSRVSMTEGGACAVVPKGKGWELRYSVNLDRQKCSVSCLAIDRRVSPFEIFYKSPDSEK